MSAAPTPALAGQSAAPRLRRHADFLLLWTASTVSELGTSISELALPLVAILTLGASPIGVGLLSTAGFAPYLLVSLPAGAWVDRVRRRPLLVACDLLRLAAMASVPLAWWSGRLSLAQLFAVAFAVAALTIVFDLAYQAWLPELVPRERLVGANAALQVGEQSCSVAGPGIGGLLVGRLGAPVAVLADAVSYLLSAVLVVRMRGDDRPVARAVAAGRGWAAMLGDVREGFAVVVRDPVLRGLAATSAIAALFGRALYVVLLVHLVRDAGMSGGTIGLLLSIASVGFVAGAALAERIVDSLGVGRCIGGAALVMPIAFTLLALTIGAWAAPLTVIGFGLYGVMATVFTVGSLSVRQTAAPRALLARVNATMRFLSWGTLPVAGVLGGALGSTIGLTPAMLVCAACAFAAVVPALGSPLRQMRTLG